MVGQKFIQLLEHHPWFTVCGVAASSRSTGKPYREAVQWKMDTPIPADVAEMTVQPCDPNFPCKVAFSGLDSAVAGEIEQAFASAGYAVISNAGNHRMKDDVPLMIADVNDDHLQLVRQQSYPDGGMIVTNPNCSVIGLAMALKALQQQFGLSSVHVVTQQALSGAGYPGVASLDIMDNIVPYIGGEEEKIESEPQKILGKLQDKGIDSAAFTISATATRVPVTEGHLASVSVKLESQTDANSIIEAWRNYRGRPQQLALPTAPQPAPILYFTEYNFPQPKLHRNLLGGMAVSVGRLRPCSIFDWKFIVLSHNTVRGAAGAALLNAELMAEEGYLSSYTVH
jgi:aspartate-semialdehyde dehydrogenase